MEKSCFTIGFDGFSPPFSWEKSLCRRGMADISFQKPRQEWFIVGHSGSNRSAKI